jgi:Tol biopolymer transport system component/predicted Ser/Thr protein kinase
MSFPSGARVGPYEILAPAGAGGMGEVYKARDTRLDRLVAIKILRNGWGHDPDRKARFEREAKVLAGLQHAHICCLHDLGSHDGVDFLVMEYLEGQTLADRLAKGPLPAGEALRLAIEIVSALEQAHRRGITHRDLKPGNIMLTKSGAKLLDFGLAKTQAPPIGAADATLTNPLTVEGSIPGTLQYMSPEQLEGKEADARSDVFAFGAVLYEMASGLPAFQGKSRVSLMMAIVDREPPSLATLPPLAGRPERIGLDRVVRTCLKKEPEERWQTAGELLHALKWIAEDPAPTAAPLRLTWAPWAVAGVAAAALAGLILTGGRSRPQPAEIGVVRFALAPPEGTSTPPGTSSLAVSPDGRSVALIERDAAGKSALWVHPLGSVSARRLEHTEDAGGALFWSPDAQFIAFTSGGRLNRIAASGGPVQVICERCGGGAGTWNRDGVIVLTGGRANRGLFRAPAAGGVATPVTALDEAGGEIFHNAPQFLPDGKNVLYLAVNKDPAKSAIYVQEIGSAQRKLVMNTRTRAAYSPPGYLLFVRDGTLLAQRFDAGSFQMRGEPAPVAEDVAVVVTNSAPLFTVSANGVLAYRSVYEQNHMQLVWSGRDGKRTPASGEPGWYTEVKLSPDEKRVAAGRRDGRNPYADVRMLELASGIFSPLTFDPSIMQYDATWSPDSRRIVVSANPAGKTEIREIGAASGATAVLFSSPDPMYLGDWSRDGRFLVYHNVVGGGTTVYLLPLFGERKPQMLLKARFLLDQFHFSPDGRSIAYNSNESGRQEVYIASLPSWSEKRQVSIGGGVQPLWRNDGRELFYLTLEGKLMTVDVKPGSTIETGIPKPLFQTSVTADHQHDLYSVTGDGKRFLMIEPTKKATGEVNVVLNWDAGLRH